MFDLLVVGGLGVDIRVRVPSIPVPAADSITVPPIDLRIGNTGAGVALAAYALGLRVALVDVVGADPAGTDAPAVRIPAATPPLPVTDTNGAGDAFAAGFIAARLRGLPPVKAAGYAARVAAAACTHDGMDYPPHLLARE